MKPDEAWNAASRWLESVGIPMSVLHKGCLAQYELADALRVVPTSQPVHALEIGSFVGLTACVLGMCLPEGSSIVSIDPGFPLNLQLREAGITDFRPCLAVAKTLKQELALGDRVAFVEGFFSCRPTSEFRGRLSAEDILYDGIPVVGETVRVRGPFDLIVADGEHSAEAVASDLQLAASMLRDCGIIVAHDMTGYWGERVRRGVDVFLDSNSAFALRLADNLGFISKVK